VAAALDKAALLRPDLVVVTGDLVDFDPRFVPVVARQLERMRAREGVAAVLGNHDYYVGAARVVDGLRAAGVRMLVNESMLVAAGDGGGFLLAGVDDLSARRTGQGVGPRLERATRRPDAPSGAGPALDRAIVLLCHQPRYFDVAAGRVDAQLSGHTHGGQIGVGAWPARLLFEYVAGRYERSGSVLWVNRGIGVAGPPARVGAPAEITRIVLTS
jgi:predicted MPP superfamily phosphohydrolase